MDTKAIYFLTGSSASGKTTLLNGVIRSKYPKLNAHYFDELGVPTIEEMNEKFGGPAHWQAYNIRRWIKKITETQPSGMIVLDGQARPNIIIAAIKETNISAIHITLITCSHEERKNRLRNSRTQPELDQIDMYAWAAYLHGQADALHLEIIDTTGKSIKESIRELAESIERFAKEVGIELENDSAASEG